MRNITNDECSSFEEVRNLFEEAFREIDILNILLSPLKKEKEKKMQVIIDAERKKQEAREEAQAAADLKEKMRLDAERLLASVEAEEKAKKEAEERKKERAKKIAKAKELLKKK